MSIKGLEKLPSKEKLISTLKKTIEKSWKIDIEVDAVTDWLNNFKGEKFDIAEEQHLALWLLCNFTYYNKEDVRHLCKSLHNIFIHKILEDFSIKDEKEMKDLISKVTYSAIGGASQSGNYLLYDYRHEAGLHYQNFAYPTNIGQYEDSIVVFIDDVILTGGTAETFFKDNLENFKAKKIYYISLFASETAIQLLKKYNVEVVYGALLSSRNKCFSSSSMIYSNYRELLEPSHELALHYGAKLMKKAPLGYGNSQFCFGFYYNTPNNTLPIFWSDINKWKPIFERRGKKRVSRYYI